MGRKKAKGYDSIFSIVGEEFAAIGDRLPEVCGQALEDVAEGVESDVDAAITKANFPAGGKYSTGDVAGAALHGEKAVYNGLTVSIGLGFDKTIQSPAGWLITGTPKMKPDMALNNIFRGKKYQTSLAKELQNAIKDLCEEVMS